MKNLFKYMIAIMMGVGFFTTSAFAAEDCSKRKTKEEAVAMVDAAVAYYKANGRDKAMAEYSNQAGPFKKCELFLLVLDMKGVVLAHTALPKMIGKSIMPLTDKNGFKMVESFIADMQTKDRGWAKPYVFINPQNQTLEPKHTYLAKIADKDGEFLIGCGYHTAP